MEITELGDADVADAVALWEAVGLTRPWNDPQADFSRALHGATSTVLGARDGDDLLGTAMVGSDGHRGWLYYVAVAPTQQRQGLGSALVAAAERWLEASGSIKVQLMVRSENAEVLAFYQGRGYEVESVRVLSRWL